MLSGASRAACQWRAPIAAIYLPSRVRALHEEETRVPSAGRTTRHIVSRRSDTHPPSSDDYPLPLPCIACAARAVGEATAMEERVGEVMGAVAPWAEAVVEAVGSWEDLGSRAKAVVDAQNSAACLIPPPSKTCC